MTRIDLAKLFASVAPKTSEGADLVLDLRDLLLSRGHPGKCIKCFFGLLGELDRPGSLAPLRLWLEERVEIAVSAEGNLLETLPVDLGKGEDLDSFCNRLIGAIREDRAYTDRHIDLKFRYRELTSAN